MAHALRTLLRISLLVATGHGCAITAADEGTVDLSSRLEGPLLSAEDDTPCPGEDGEAAAARRALAHVRALAGLPALRCDGAAMRAAAGHCVYLETNHELTHFQQRGRPAFTGVTFQDRLAKAGFDDEPSSEVIAQLTGAYALEHARGLLNSVYHRAPFLRIESASFGYGGGKTCATIDFGRVAHAKLPSTTVVWPPDGARNVPISFRADRERPNPVPFATLVGSPISLVGTDAIVEIDATLRGPDGAALAAVLLTAKEDPAHLIRAAEAHLVPKRPLARETTYRATFRGRTAKGAFELGTTFTTGRADAGEATPTQAPIQGGD